jgi:hypothetical protein
MVSSQKIRDRVSAGNITMSIKFPVIEAPHKGAGG